MSRHNSFAQNQPIKLTKLFKSNEGLNDRKSVISTEFHHNQLRLCVVSFIRLILWIPFCLNDSWLCTNERKETCSDTATNEP